jgi:hypothetical protein
MKIEDFRQLVRELIEDEIEEMTTTGDVGGFGTPFAFQGKKKANRSKRRETAQSSGFSIAQLDDEEDRKLDEITDAQAKMANKIAKSFGGKFGWSGSQMGIWVMTGPFNDEYYNKVVKILKANDINIGEPKYVGKNLFIPINEAIAKKESMNEAGDPYYAWRNDETASPKKKIGTAISEINSTLKEAEKVIKRCGRLKKEMGMSSNDYWKRTNGALLKIEQRVHKLAGRVREMRV